MAVPVERRGLTGRTRQLLTGRESIPQLDAPPLDESLHTSPRSNTPERVESDATTTWSHTTRGLKGCTGFGPNSSGLFRAGVAIVGGTAIDVCEES